MTIKHILDHGRIRRISGSFGFIQHRFLRDGFLSTLEKDEIVLYLFWVLAADRFGLSYYGETRIREVLNFSASELKGARRGLIKKDLICWEDPLVQVLELPLQSVGSGEATPSRRSFEALHRMLEP